MNEKKSQLTDLYQDMKNEIFNYLEPEDVIRLASTSTLFEKNPNFWRNICVSNKITLPPNSEQYKNAFFTKQKNQIYYILGGIIDTKDRTAQEVALFTESPKTLPPMLSEEQVLKSFPNEEGIFLIFLNKKEAFAHAKKTESCSPYEFPRAVFSVSFNQILNFQRTEIRYDDGESTIAAYVKPREITIVEADLVGRIKAIKFEPSIVLKNIGKAKEQASVRKMEKQEPAQKVEEQEPAQHKSCFSCSIQ
jgi:hypothetical protein